jgi:hypothetical protein
MKLKIIFLLLIIANILYWGFSSWFFSGDINCGLIIGLLTSILFIIAGAFFGVMMGKKNT